MSEHTTFRVGGPADLYVVPTNVADVQKTVAYAADHELPLFVLGGGANILVSDAGIRGAVMDMSLFSGVSVTEGREDSVTLEAGAGMPISDVAAWAATNSYAGLEFIFSMPGSVAGAVWMNARCYDGEISRVLSHVDVIRQDGTTHRYVPADGDFGYKLSPFQRQKDIMLSVGFHLKHGESKSLWREMEDHEQDRRSKGHFDKPCAGSFFKNNRAFGKPTGALLDDIGMRGVRRGGAQVSEKHANIIVNTGNATARDIKDLSDHLSGQAEARLGIALEREVLLVGDWSTS